MNGGNCEGIDGEDSLKGFYAYKNTFGADNIWVDVPKHVTFVTDTEAFDDSPTSVHPPSLPRRHVREGHRVRSSSDTFQTPPHHLAQEDWLAHVNSDHFIIPPPQPLRLETLSAAASAEQHSYFPSSAVSDSALMQRPYHIDIPSSISNIQQMPTPPVSDQRDPRTMMVTSPTGYPHHGSMSPIDTMALHRSTTFDASDLRHSSPVPSASRMEFGMSASMPPVTSNPDPSLMHEQTPSVTNHSIGPLGTPNISTYTPQSMNAVIGKKRGYEASLDSDPSGDMAERDVESAVLLRHFVEIAGQWLDLYDSGKYFTEHLPARLSANPLLRSAVMAFTAKQLSRSQGLSSGSGGICSRPGKTEHLPGATESSWLYRANQYNDQAISLLANALREENEAAGNSPVSFREDSDFSGDRRKRRRLSVQRQVLRNPDDLLIASAILCVYEFIDGSSAEFTRHLDGARTLLNMGDGNGQKVLHRRSPSGGHMFSQQTSTRSRRAAFWSVARQDFTAAFINERPTRLNCDDLALWRGAGLMLDDTGTLQLRAKTMPSILEPDDSAWDDSVSHGLVYLLCKIVNYISASDALAVGQQFETIPEDEALLFEPGNPNTGAHQRMLLERWFALHRQLELWHCALPDTFKPSARISPIAGSDEAFAEVWYTSPKRASVMQHYHMAKILLLINKPALNTFAIGSHRLKSYHSIDAEIRYHSHEICGIAISNPGGSARVHMLQPLFVGGQCLHDPSERHIILELLRNIESDLGFATSYRVNTLLQDWGWSQSVV